MRAWTCRPAPCSACAPTPSAAASPPAPSFVVAPPVSYRRRQKRGRQKFCSFERLVTHSVKRRNAVVPFRKRRRVPQALNRPLVKFPHRIDHRMIVRVQNVPPVLRVPRNMYLRHTLRRHAVHIVKRIEAVILRGNIDIVHVQQNSAVPSLHHFIQKLPFGNLPNTKLRIPPHSLSS